jgi:hypothetical protein
VQWLWYASFLSDFLVTVSDFMEELQVRFLFWPDGPHFFLIPVADNADRQPFCFSLVLQVFPGRRFRGS